MDVPIKEWVLAFSAAILSLLIATANGRSGLSVKMERVIVRYLPPSSPEIMVRYVALLITGLFAAAYTILGVRPSNYQAIFASALSSTIAIELFPAGGRGEGVGLRHAELNTASEANSTVPDNPTGDCNSKRSGRLSP
jgi:hypothetical protein